MKMSFFHLLTLVFVVAKLAGYFPYSWFLVFLPSAISISIGVVILLLAFVAFCIGSK